MSIALTSGIVILILSILAWHFSEKNKFKELKFIHFAYAIFVTFAVSVLGDLGWSEHYFLAIVGGYMLLHLIVGMIWKTKSDWAIFGLVAGTGAAMLFVPEGHIHFGEHEVLTNSPHAFVSLLMGGLMLPLIQGLEKKLGKFFKLDFKSQRGISRSVFFIYIGIALLMCGFFLSLGGWIFFAAGFTAMMLYSKRSGAMWNLLLAVYTPSVIVAMMMVADIDIVALSSAKVMTGVLAAGFVALMMNTLTRARKNKNLALYGGLFLAIACALVLLFGSKIHVQFGGYDAFIGLLFGFALTAMYGINIKKNVVLWAIYVGMGFLVFGLEPAKTEAEQASMIPTELKEKAAPAQAVDFDDNIDLKGNASIQFSLGDPSAPTKGAIKEVEGSLTIENRVMSADVKLPVSSLTTFNQYRDESLMGDGYFIQEKFPVMTYKAMEIGKEGAVVVLEGQFTMLGKSNKEQVRMSFLGEVDGKRIFKGIGKIDRTLYGMTPDPKEGNIVDFTVEIAAPQK